MTEAPTNHGLLTDKEGTGFRGCRILVDEGIIGYQNTHMVLTKYGHRFAKLFTVTPEAPHRMYEETRIRYSPDAVQLVRGKLASIQMALGQKRDLAPDQMALPERAGR